MRSCEDRRFSDAIVLAMRSSASLAVGFAGLASCSLLVPDFAANYDAAAALDASDRDRADHVDGSSADAPSGPMFHPSGAITPADLSLPGTRDVNLTEVVTFDTDTGEITNNTRPPGAGMQNGIGFRTSASVGIFSFAALTIGAPNVHFRGSNAVALVVAKKFIQNAGLFDVQGACANGAGGPGGSAGGMSAAGEGLGAGSPGSFLRGESGGGGGGFAGVGGAGGDVAPGNAGFAVGGAGGLVYGAAALVPLVGGSGGGAGAAEGDGGTGGIGGGGGGAVQIVAGESIAIAGVVNAGGCGGGGGKGPSCTNNCGGGAGGGGGSGGAILLESRAVDVSGVLAANGGGGGGGAWDHAAVGMPGLNGGNGSVPAQGGAGSSDRGRSGGAGGAAGSPNGVPGVAWDHPGGGGGGCGRIRINSLSGTASLTGTLSPALADRNDAGAPLATLGKIDLR